jgi:hypothetical protein
VLFWVPLVADWELALLAPVLERLQELRLEPPQEQRLVRLRERLRERLRLLLLVRLLLALGLRLLTQRILLLCKTLSQLTPSTLALVIRGLPRKL